MAMMKVKQKEDVDWEAAGPYRDQAEDISWDMFGVEFDFLGHGFRRRVKIWARERIEGACDSN